MPASLAQIFAGSLASDVGYPGQLFVHFLSKRRRPAGTGLQGPDGVSPNKTDRLAQGASGDLLSSHYYAHLHGS